MLIKMRVFAYLENKIFLQGVSEDLGVARCGAGRKVTIRERGRWLGLG